MQIGKDLLVRWKQWGFWSVAQVAKTGQETARIGHHGGPNTTTGAVNIPLTTDLFCLFENDWLEPVLFQVLRSDKTPRTTANDCHFARIYAFKSLVEVGHSAS